MIFVSFCLIITIIIIISILINIYQFIYAPQQIKIKNKQFQIHISLHRLFVFNMYICIFNALSYIIEHFFKIIYVYQKQKLKKIKPVKTNTIIEITDIETTSNWFHIYHTIISGEHVVFPSLFFFFFFCRCPLTIICIFFCFLFYFTTSFISHIFAFLDVNIFR